MQKRLVLINVGVVIIGLIAAALLAMPLVRNLYLEEFHRTLDSAVMLLTTDGDEIQEDPEAFVQREAGGLAAGGPGYPPDSNYIGRPGDWGNQQGQSHRHQSGE